MNEPQQKPNVLEDYLEIILRRKWWIMIPVILGLSGAGALLFFLPPSYKSTTQILVEPQKVPESYVKSTVPVDITDRLSTITQQVMSRTRLEAIIKEMGLYPEERNRFSMEDLVDVMRKHIEINVIGKDSFTIAFKSHDPETAMNTTNKLASLFIEENLKVREEQAEGTTRFLDTQLQEVRASLEEQEAKIQNFKSQYMGELPAQLETNLRILDRLQLDLRSTNELIATSENRNTMLERQFMETNEFLSFAGGGQTPPMESNSPIARLSAMKAELSKLESEYTEKYPEVVRLRKQVKELESRLDDGILPENEPDSRIGNRNPMTMGISAQLQELKSEISTLKDKRNEITRQIKNIQSRVDRAPTREFQLAALSRDYENTRHSYQSLLDKKQDAQLSENLEKRQKGEQFRILDSANLPEKPFEPDPFRILLLGLAAGLGTGGGLAMLREYLDSSFRKAEDFYEATGLPVLATIPPSPK